MSYRPIVLLLGLLAPLAGGTYAGYGYYRQQNQLVTHLQQLTYELATQNTESITTLAGDLRGLKATVMKNRNQPHELLALHRAQALKTRTDVLRDTLRAIGDRLRRATSNPPAPLPLTYPNEARVVARLLGQDTRAQQTLRQQVATCADSLRRLGPADSAPLVAPSFHDTSVAEALAALTQLESTVLARAAQTLRHLGRGLGPAQIPTRMIAAATAESNTVAPGTTYRARLLLIKTLSPSTINMYCNNQPVAIGPDGGGHVRFRAPTRPGPAAWTAAIHLKVNGHDSTFRMRVPYWVAPR